MENFEKKGRPFALIGVNVMPYEPAALKEVMIREKLNWRTFANPNSDISRQWNSPATPSYYVIDHRGIIRNKWTGNPGARSLDQILEKRITEAEAETDTIQGKAPHTIQASAYKGGNAL